MITFKNYKNAKAKLHTKLILHKRSICIVTKYDVWLDNIKSLLLIIIVQNISTIIIFEVNSLITELILNAFLFC